MSDRFTIPDIPIEQVPSFDTEKTRRKLQRTRSRLRRMGVMPSEEKPGVFKSFMDLLSIPSYATTSAYRYSKRGESPLKGLIEGGYAGIRPSLVQMGFMPGPARAEQEFWNDVIQEIPGMEPSESTLRNFGIRILGTLIDIGVDPITYISFGGGGAIKIGLRALRRMGVPGASMLIKTPQGRRQAAEILADQFFVKRLKSGKEILSEVSGKIMGKTDEIERLLNLEWKNKGPINLGLFFGEGPKFNLVSYERIAKTGIPDVFDAVFSPRGTKIIGRVVNPEIEHWLKPEMILDEKNPLAHLFFYPAKKRVELPTRAIRPIEQTLLADMVGVPPVLQGSVNIVFDAIKEPRAYIIPKISEDVLFWKRRTGLTILDSLTTPISTLYRQAPWLTEMTRKYRNRDIVNKHTVIKDFAEPWVKMVPQEEIDNIPFYIELAKADKYASDIGPVRSGARYEEFIERYQNLMKSPKYQEMKGKFDRFVLKHGEEKWNKIKDFWDDWFSNEILPDGSYRGRLPSLISSKTDAKNFLDDYVSHMYIQHPEEREAISTIQKGISYSIIDRYMRHRNIDTLFDAVEAGFRPETNSAIIGANRIIAAFRAIEKRKYMDDFIREGMGNGIVKEAVGDRPPNGYISGRDFTRIFPQLRGYDIREDAAIHLQQNFQVYNNVSFLNLIQEATNIWKPFVTAYIPKFHIRNLWGNTWNNWLAGVTDPKTYLEALAIQAPGLQKVLGDININGMKADEVFRLAFENGIIGRGWIGSDIERTIRQDVLAIQRNLNPLTWYGRGARKFGTAIEDNARIALFIDRLKRGYSVSDAGMDVKKYLFNYDELAPFERKLRIFIPFYSWARNSIPLELEHLITRPGKFTAIPKIQNLIEGSQGKKKRAEIENQWMKEIQVIYGGVNDKGQIRMISPGMPYEDITNYIQGRHVIGLLNPFIRLFVENLSNYDFFTGKPYIKRGLEDEPQYHIARVNNQYANILPRQFWPLLGLAQYKDEHGETVTTANVRLWNIWKTMLRPAKEYVKLTDPENALFDRVINQVTGFNITDIDPQRASFFKNLEELMQAKALLREEYIRRGVPRRRRRY